MVVDERSCTPGKRRRSRGGWLNPGHDDIDPMPVAAAAGSPWDPGESSKVADCPP
jgi:hypothetical protein